MRLSELRKFINGIKAAGDPVIEVSNSTRDLGTILSIAAVDRDGDDIEPDNCGKPAEAIFVKVGK